MGQPRGAPDTGFQIHGSGFVPSTHVSVALVGVGTAKFEPQVDPKGTFNFTIDQDHDFFRKGIPIGTYHVLAKDSNGVQSARAEFKVVPPPSTNPLPGRPPLGPPPTAPPPQALGPSPGHGAALRAGPLTV